MGRQRLPPPALGAAPARRRAGRPFRPPAASHRRNFDLRRLVAGLCARTRASAFCSPRARRRGSARRSSSPTASRSSMLLIRARSAAAPSVSGRRRARRCRDRAAHRRVAGRRRRLARDLLHQPAARARRDPARDPFRRGKPRARRGSNRLCRGAPRDRGAGRPDLCSDLMVGAERRIDRAGADRARRRNRHLRGIPVGRASSRKPGDDAARPVRKPLLLGPQPAYVPALRAFGAAMLLIPYVLITAAAIRRCRRALRCFPCRS